MKHLCSLIAIVLLTQQAYATRWLAIVDLTGRPQLKAWHEAGLPANQIAGNTAIAVLDDIQLMVAKTKGFAPQQLELYDPQAEYLLVDNRYTKDASPGHLLWQGGQLGLYRAASTLKRFDSHFAQRLSKTPLPARFWHNMTKTSVMLSRIARDSFIQDLVDQVNADSLTAVIQRLQNFQTRLSLSDSCYAAEDWIRSKLSGWGYDAQLDSFYENGSLYFPPGGFPGTGFDRNVVASVSGTMQPQRKFIVSGHLDATTLGGYSRPLDTILCRTNAPGADDNASGTAATLEIARILQGTPLEPTVVYGLWAAEESYLLGSGHYAAAADSLNEDIGGVLNMDMIGWMDNELIDLGIGRSHEFSRWLEQLFIDAAADYVPELVLYTGGGNGSDDLSFANCGYPALMLIEASLVFNPYYHTTNETLDKLNYRLYTAVTKATLATLAIVGTYPGPVQNLTVSDMGDGQRLVVSWVANPETDIAGYQVYWGRSSGTYTDSAFVTAMSDTIDGLMADSLYYFIVAAQDNQGHLSYQCEEITGTARLAPLAPDPVTASPLTNGIRIDWKRNTELDLQGYRLYQAVNDTMVYDSLNTVLLMDTTFTATPLSGANKYYYKVRAFDTDGNFGPLSDQAYGRPITLNQGILVVDETNNWTSGNFPRDTQQDSFYEYLMAGYQHEQYDFGGTAQKPGLASLGPYSTVVWHSDDPSMFLASNDSGALREYLGHGGKLWFTGWRSAADIGNSTTYPADFAAGSLLYDCFSISHAELSGTTDSFKTAIGLRGYPDISVDTAKYPATIWGKVMRNMEAYVPAGSADTIYAMDMKNNGSAFEGRACAVRDSGRMVLFGFPLYYMNRNQARLAAQKVMAEFGEPITGVAGLSTPLEVRGLRLEKCRPNPFKHSTNINYHIPKPGMVNLSVYNIAGQRIRTLVNGAKPAGNHQIKWDGRDDSKRSLSAGIYFVRLNAEGSTQTRKLMLVR